MKVLIIDDDQTVCSSLTLLLRRKGFEVDQINHPNLFLEKMQGYEAELILLDMNFTIDTSGKQGLKLLKEITNLFPKLPVILMTGWATVQLAVEGMKIGAKDFIAKPWDNKELLNSIENINQLYLQKNKSFTNNSESNFIIGQSDGIMKVLEMVDRVAPTEANILISGESGTGKELIAEAIHQKSYRNNENFIKVNLGGLPSELFESEMFGHKKGAFTGAYQDREGRFSLANKGTIFLDEIGELNLSSQVKMLRVLQEKTFEPLGSSKTQRADVRVISASNRDLKKMVDVNSFREDLFYRINLINIHLPPLSQRRTDIPILVNHFINKLCELYDNIPPLVRTDTYEWLSKQEYPGNIRQLKNITERTILLNLKKKELEIKDFAAGFNFSEPGINKSGELNLEQMEIESIKKALTRYNHSISSASRALGITRSSLYRRLEKYNIPHEPKI